MTFTLKDLEKLGYSLQPDGSYANTKHTPNVETATPASPARLHHAKPQPTAPQALDDRSEGQARSAGRPPACVKDATRTMKAKSKKNVIAVEYSPQHRIIITRFAPRCLDIDNFAGGCKAIIDSMKEAQLIPDDDPASVTIEFRQQKCRQIDQRTEIELFTPELQ